MSEPIWITEAEVTRLLSLPDAIDALKAGLRAEADGSAQTMVKTHVSWGGGHTLHAIGAVSEAAGHMAVKSWGHTGGGATPFVTLWDSESGAVLAIIEAFALGQMRTGGVSGVAADALTQDRPARLALIGTGKQALTQLAAIMAVRPLEQVRVHSPNRDNREAFAARAAAALGLAIEPADSVDAAVEDASIVTLVTRAREPFLHARHLDGKDLLVAVGAITPEREEFSPGVIEAGGRLVVDNLAAVRRLSREFQRAGETDPAIWERIEPLSAVLAGAGAARPGCALFKAMGMGLSDLALASAIYTRALDAGAGRPFLHPERAPVRLTRA